ncbi:MAG TPA: hypothetical protein VIA18_00405 [Polyangia bacterium]|nr:hypothetical protein [Polyangia bacterium]
MDAHRRAAELERKRVEDELARYEPSATAPMPASCPASRMWTRFSGGKEGTLWYYRALAQAFDDRVRPAEELRRVVGDLPALA